MSAPIVLDCLRGFSAGRPVLIGFAPANLLHELSFPDLLDEEAGTGYQRPFNSRHSQDFRRYIQNPTSTTIPLTLNLRAMENGSWRTEDVGLNRARLVISPEAGPVMAQVDCQHRLGHLADLPIPLPFMCFIDLSPREEMEIFNVINGKARGLSTSLLDYHDAHMATDLLKERPELFIALQLNSLEDSPWYRKLNLGGKGTAGLKRIVSLRMMQQTVADFLRLTKSPPEDALRTLLDFWKAVAAVLPDEWASPRHFLLTKGVGVYALMHIAADIYLEQIKAEKACDKRAYVSQLADFVNTIDWTRDGDLKGFGGQTGVRAAVSYLREKRRGPYLKVMNGQ